LLVVFLLIVPGLFWGLPSAITPQVDSPFPLGPLLFFAEYKRYTANTVYPAFHQMLMLPIYGVAGILFWLTGGIGKLSSTWPYGFKDVSLFFSVLIFLTNLVAACMAVGLLWLLLRVVKQERNWAWAALLILGTNGVFVYYARVGNLDMPYTFWWGVAVFFLWGHFFGEGASRRSLVAAGIAAGLAAATKDQASSLGIGAAVIICLMSPKLPQTLWQRCRTAFLFGAALLAAYTCAAIVPNPMRWWQHAQFVVSPHAPTNIPMSPAGQVEIFWLTIKTLLMTYSIPVVAIAAVGGYALLRGGRQREFWLLFGPMIAYYVIIIAKTRVVYPRFMIPAAIPIFAFVTVGLTYLATRWGPKIQFAVAGAAAVIILYQLATSYLPVTYAQIFDMKRVSARELPNYLPPGEALVTSSMQTHNYPNRNLYEHYKLMLLPNDPVFPASRHAEGIFQKFDPEARYYLLGSGTAGLPWHVPGSYPHFTGHPVKQWRFPEWIRSRVLVPVLYEFTLYERTAPWPLNDKVDHSNER
jgi:4-amino-4-deoxy-L-arabinose transferase-like glycosyltransferase